MATPRRLRAPFLFVVDEEGVVRFPQMEGGTLLVVRVDELEALMTEAAGVHACGPGIGEILADLDGGGPSDV